MKRAGKYAGTAKYSVTKLAITPSLALKRNANTISTDISIHTATFTSIRLRNTEPEEKKFLENALSQSDELRQEMEMLNSLRKRIKQSTVTSFKPFFADRVMEKIRSSSQVNINESFFDSLFLLFRPVAIAAIILVIAIAGYNIATTGQFSLEGALGIPEVTVDAVYDPTLAFVAEE